MLHVVVYCVALLVKGVELRALLLPRAPRQAAWMRGRGKITETSIATMTNT